MRFTWPSFATQGYWLSPALGGVLLIVVGFLIYANPNLLAYFVAALFVIGGSVLLSIAWRMRHAVTYRRLDEDGGPLDDDRSGE